MLAPASGRAYCLAYAVFFAGNVLQPLWLQTRLGYIATWAGLVAAPSGVVAVLMTPVFTRFGWVDARITGTIAMAAFSVSFFMRAGYTPDASFGALVPPMLVQGLAMSTFFVSLLTIQFRDVPAHQTPAASGLSNFARITFGAFGAALVTAAWDRREAVHQVAMADGQASHAQAWTRALSALQGQGLTPEQSLGALAYQVVNQAYTLAASTCSGSSA